MITFRISLPMLAAAIFLTVGTRSQTLVKDIRPGLSNPSGFSTSATMFASSAGLYMLARNSLVSPGIEQLLIWDGVASNASPIWNSGGVSGSVFFGIEQLPNGLILFGASASGQGRELYVSDGTQAGTSMINIWPGSGSGYGQFLGAFGNSMMFAGNDGVNGEELWITDGTVAGTYMLVDINPGSSGSRLEPGIEFQGRFYLPADDGVNHQELWVTDGTAAGTQLFVDLNPTRDSHVGELTVLGSALLFTAFRLQQGTELFRTDGTPGGTNIIADLAPGMIHALPEELTVIGSTCYFRATDGVTGFELWQTDGNTITQVKDIRPGVFDSQPQDLRIVNGGLMFTADNGINGRELWRSDGTGGGTVMVADLTPGGAATGFTADGFGVAFGTQLVFSANAGGFGSEPWVSDGTSGGTMLLRDINPGAALASDPHDFTVWNGGVYFNAADNVLGRELWGTDGTPAGTDLALEIAPTRPLGSAIANMVALGDRVVFSANDGVNGIEIWTSDGTAAGTLLLGDITVGTGTSFPSFFAVFGGRIYFSASGPSGRELYATDGTPAGTVLVKDINPGTGSSSPRHFTAWNGELYFSADGPSRHLWKTDGTAAGTVLVAAISMFDSIESPIIPLVNQMLVQATTQLYTSDGTTAGTVLVDPVNGVQVNYNAVTLGIGNVGYFFGNRGGLFDLWRSDGTPAGTQHVYQFDQSGGFTAVGGIYELFEFDGKLLIQAEHKLTGGGGYGRELFTSDGTTAGTMLLRDIVPFPGSGSWPRGLRRAYDRVMFTADDAVTGRELWLTDGTTAGTVMVADVAPGLGDGVLGSLSVVGVGRRVAFAGIEPMTGQEAWVSDGTAAGTQRLFDLQPGMRDGVLGRLVRAGDKVFFVGDDGVTGAELYAFPASLLESADADSFGAGCTGSNGVPAIGYAGAPAVGNNDFAIELSNAIASFPILLLGSGSRTDVPLGGGCTLYPTGPAITLATASNPTGEGSVPVPLPNTVSLIGAELIVQWATIDPAGPFVNFAAFSDGLRIRVGRS